MGPAPPRQSDIAHREAREHLDIMVLLLGRQCEPRGQLALCIGMVLPIRSQVWEAREYRSCYVPHPHQYGGRGVSIHRRTACGVGRGGLRSSLRPPRSTNRHRRYLHGRSAWCNSIGFTRLRTGAGRASGRYRARWLPTGGCSGEINGDLRVDHHLLTGDGRGRSGSPLVQVHPRARCCTNAGTAGLTPSRVGRGLWRGFRRVVGWGGRHGCWVGLWKKGKGSGLSLGARKIAASRNDGQG